MQFRLKFDELNGIVESPFDAIVYPLTHGFGGRWQAQPSKNYTARYLLVAGMANGESRVGNCARSQDAQAMRSALTRFGCKYNSDGLTTSGGEDFLVLGVAGQPELAEPNIPVDVGNAGAVLRFLLGVGALLPKVTFSTPYVHSLGKRPNEDMLEALRQLNCRSDSQEGRLPITLYGAGLAGGEVTISGARSSQFLSGLLFLAPMLPNGLRIKVNDGLVSKAPVEQTIEVISAAGGRVETGDKFHDFFVHESGYAAGSFSVNGDWPGSAALLACAAVTGGVLRLDGLKSDGQGEKEAGAVLAQMGCNASFDDSLTSFKLSAEGVSLTGVDFDGDLATDAVLALCGAAALSNGRTRFYNVSNLRIKECDRISEPIIEMRKLGVRCWEGHELGDSDPDAIIIDGNPAGYEGGVTVDGRGDHRVIMLLSIIALRCRKPVRITGAHHVAKSYPEWFTHLRSGGANVETVNPG